MNIFKIIIKYMATFIIGNIFFNLVYIVTQIFLLNVLKGDTNINILAMYIEATTESIKTYLVIYLILYITGRIYSIYITKKLNYKLNKIKVKGGN